MEGFRCIICKEKNFDVTGSHPRDRREADIVVCKTCGHVQMYPLLSKEEYDEEYALDKTVRESVADQNGKSDFDDMRTKFSEWTKQHVDMYWDKLQQHKRVLELASGYGFFAEMCNQRDDRQFEIEGVEIGAYRLENYVGGVVHDIDFYTDEIPQYMLGKYDLIICMHLLEHLTDPVTYLENIKPLLKDGGEVIFEMPNLKCFLAELSPEYAEFIYFYEHVSYYYEDTLRLVFERAGYKVNRIYTREIYSIENHIRWIREGKPFTKYNQMFLPDSRMEFINEEYKKRISQMGKGFSLVIEAGL